MKDILKEGIDKNSKYFLYSFKSAFLRRLSVYIYTLSYKALYDDSFV